MTDTLAARARRWAEHDAAIPYRDAARPRGVAIVESAPEVDADTKPRLGRRISWEEFWQLRPDLRPDNDNQKARDAA